MNGTYIHTPLTLPAQGMFEGESRVNVGDLERQATALLTQLNHELVHLSLARMLRTIPGLLGIRIRKGNLKGTPITFSDIIPDIADKDRERGKVTLGQFQAEIKALQQQMMFPKRGRALAAMFEKLPLFTTKDPFYRRDLRTGGMYVSAQAVEAYLETVLPPETIARERAAELAKRPAAAAQPRPRQRA